MAEVASELTPDSQAAARAADAALWLLAQLPPESRQKVRRRFALKLTPVELPSARYRRDLLLVAELLRDVPPSPGWTFPIVSRQAYDAARALGVPTAMGAPT